MSSEAVGDGGTPDHIDTVAEMVDALGVDPVLVEPTMGNGHTAQVREHLEGLAARAADGGVPVFAVATTTPVGLDPSSADEQIVTLLHDALDEPGVYVVETTQGTGALGVYGDLGTGYVDAETTLSLRHYEAHQQMVQAAAERWGEDANEASVTWLAAALEAAVDVAERDADPDPGAELFDGQPALTAAETAAYATDTWFYATVDYDSQQSWEPATPGLAALTVTLTLVLVTVCCYRLLRAFSASEPAAATAATGSATATTKAPRAARRTPPHASRALGYRHPPETLRRRAADRLDRTADELTTQVLRDLPAPLVDTARGSIEEGRRLLEPEPSSSAVAAADDDLCAVGAWVLSETAWSVVRRRGDGTWRCCFVNPTHGEATTEEDLGGGAVPVCAECRDRTRDGRPLQPLRTRVRRPWRTPQVVAYYEVDGVWARTGFGALGDDLWRELGRERAQTSELGSER